MTRDKKIAYISLSLLCLALLLPQFLDGVNNRVYAAALLLPVAVFLLVFLKRRITPYYTRRTVLLLISVFGVLYVILYYLLGLSFGFIKNPYLINFDIALEFVLPTAAVIVSVELIRSVSRAQNSKAVDFLSYLVAVIGDVSLFLGVVRVETFNRFMDLFGLTLLPSIIANLVYHYLVKRYGAAPNIVYKLITSLYTYLFIFDAATPDAITSLIKVLWPVFIFVFIDMLFERKRRFAVRRSGAIGYTVAGAALAFIVSFVMLISCKFHYGAIIIATESMTGEYNKGDALIYEQYEGEAINVDDVVVFNRRGNRIVHRVVEVVVENDEVRIYTKGDANDSADAGYITPSDIVGIAKTKIPGIGYLTLWMREMVHGAFSQEDAL